MTKSLKAVARLSMARFGGAYNFVELLRESTVVRSLSLERPHAMPDPRPPSSDPRRSAAEKVFLAHVAGLAEGAAPDIQSLVRKHPELASALREVYSGWAWLEAAKRRIRDARPRA